MSVIRLGSGMKTPSGNVARKFSGAKMAGRKGCSSCRGKR